MSDKAKADLQAKGPHPVTPPVAQKKLRPAARMDSVALQCGQTNPLMVSPADVLVLQRSTGNHAVVAIIQRKPASADKKEPTLPSAEELSARIARCIGIWETNRGHDQPAPKESKLDTVAGVPASMATIEQATFPYAITALIKHEELRAATNPPLKLTELQSANQRCLAVSALLKSVAGASAKGQKPDDYIKANTATIDSTGLSNDDVKSMFSAVTLKGTIDRLRAEVNSKGKKPGEAVGTIPEGDRLGLSQSSLKTYLTKPKTWGENEKGWQRKAVEAMPDKVGQRIQAVATSRGGTAMAAQVIRARVDAQLAHKPAPSFEAIVKTVGQQNNPHEKDYGENIWKTYQRLYPEAPKPSAPSSDVQRAAANHRAPPPLQPKLLVGAAGDRYEQEADRIAVRVLRMPEPALLRKANEDEEIQAQPLADTITPLVQRGGAQIDGFVAGAEFEQRLAASRGGGQPLPVDVLSFMEPRFGVDFSSVRLHTGSEAAQLNREIGAQAFTNGRDIYLGEGRSDTRSAAGTRLLAHELTHVVQQSTSPMSSGSASSLDERISCSPVGATKLQPADNQVTSNRPQALPSWNALPPYAQDDLARRGYHEAWFKNKDAKDLQTVLNLYVKLKGLRLWEFVTSESGTTGKGCLEFLTSDLRGLRNALTARDDFTSPERSLVEWSSREMKASGQLHFKHFRGWSQLDKVQAHIDKHGLLLASKWWWLVPAVPLAQMLVHGLTYKTFEDVYGVRDLLLNEGWDPAVLIGTHAGTVQRYGPSTNEWGTEDTKREAHRAVGVFRQSTASGVWRNLKRDRIADEMDRRIDNPTIINQVPLSLCGPASIVHLLAAQHPVQYVTIMQKLFATGETSLNGDTLRAGRDLRKNAPPTQMAQADWMILSSMRDSDNIAFDFEGTKGEDFSGITTPDEIIKWMKSVLRCKTAEWKSAWVSDEIPVLREAGNAVAAGKGVVLLINAAMLGDPSEVGWVPRPDHWVVLRSRVHLYSEKEIGDKSKQKINFKVWTWGESDLRTLDLDTRVASKTFFGAAICDMQVPNQVPSKGQQNGIRK